MPASKVMLPRVFWVRLAALLFTCVAFSVAVHGANVHGGMADWCIFCWVFSFTCTLLVLLVEQFGLQARIPVSWSNISITVARYATLLCLFASFIFPLFFIALQWYANERSFRITSTVFSCLAVVAYMYEKILIKARARQVAGYMAMAPGLLKVYQTIVACIIFILISNPVSYSHHEALEWCMAVYCICFIVSMVVLILCVGEWTGRKSVPFSQFLSAYGLLAFLMYLSAVIVWPIFTFGEKYRRGGDMTTQIMVAVLTGINMLLYLADLVYTALLVFITRRPGAPPPRVPADKGETSQLNPDERPYHDPANDPAHVPVNDPANDPANDPVNDPANNPAHVPANDSQVTTQIINMPTVH